MEPQEASTDKRGESLEKESVGVMQVSVVHAMGGGSASTSDLEIYSFLLAARS